MILFSPAFSSTAPAAPAGTVADAVAGLAFGLSLIVAIGAQNAFVLRQGLVRRHVAPVVAICAASDAVLVGVGIAGIGTLVGRYPAVLEVVRWLGAAFLVGYGLLAARRAFSLQALTGDATPPSSRRSAILTCLALTWLNPHVYLDTVLLLGSVAATHGPSGRWLFGAGAATASLLWFVSLGYGARLLAPLFARPLSWRVLDGTIAATMLTLGVRLAVHV